MNFKGTRGFPNPVDTGFDLQVEWFVADDITHKSVSPSTHIRFNFRTRDFGSDLTINSQIRCDEVQLALALN